MTMTRSSTRSSTQRARRALARTTTTLVVRHRVHRVPSNGLQQPLRYRFLLPVRAAPAAGAPPSSPVGGPPSAPAGGPVLADAPAAVLQSIASSHGAPVAWGDRRRFVSGRIQLSAPGAPLRAPAPPHTPPSPVRRGPLDFPPAAQRSLGSLFADIDINPINPPSPQYEPVSPREDPPTPSYCDPSYSPTPPASRPESPQQAPPSNPVQDYLQELRELTEQLEEVLHRREREDAATAARTAAAAAADTAARAAVGAAAAHWCPSYSPAPPYSPILKNYQPASPVPGPPSAFFGCPPSAPIEAPIEEAPIPPGRYIDITDGSAYFPIDLTVEGTKENPIDL